MEALMGQAKESIRLTYRAIGTSAGQIEFVGASNEYKELSDFGCGDVPISSQEHAALVQAGRPVMQLPFVLGAVTVFHSVPLSIGPLRLGPCTLAKIFSGAVTTWDAADILDDNPDLVVPEGEPIRVFRRSDGSSSTGGITAYLETVCPEHWRQGSGTLVDWPESFSGRDGSAEMVDSLRQTPYAIGYLDLGHGRSAGLYEAQLQNANGSWLAASDADITAAAEAGAALPPDAMEADINPYIDLINQPGDDTWPIVQLSYLYLSKDQRGNGEKGSLLRAMVQYLVSSEVQQHIVQQFGFRPIPDTLVRYDLAALDALDLPELPGPVWRFENSTHVQPSQGQADNVFSGRRRSYSLLAVEELHDSVAGLEAELGALQQSASLALHGSGTTNPSRYLLNVMGLLKERLRFPSHLTYRAVGSGTGQVEFTGEANMFEPYNDFGAGDIPLPRDNWLRLAELGLEMLHVPFALSTVSVFHNVPGTQPQPLRLDVCALAGIFAGRITAWDDPAILSVNPGLEVPEGAAIRVFRRVLGSSSTAALTQYLAAGCPGLWQLGSGSTVPWPAATTGVQGSQAMRDALQTTNFSIGYLESGFGRSAGLPEVQLQNAASRWLQSDQADVASATQSAAFPASFTSDFSDISVLNQLGPQAWPLTTVSYFYVRTDQRSRGSTGSVLRVFLEVVLSEEGQQLLEQYNMVPLEPELLQRTREQLALLQLAPDAPRFAMEAADQTLPSAGAAATTVSGKRQDYTSVALEEMGLRIATLASKVDRLEQLVQAVLQSNSDKAGA